MSNRAEERIAANLKWVLRNRVLSSPTAIRLLHVMPTPARRLSLTKQTELIIEGFPRCGNSFAVVAFELAQEPRRARIAHHLHAAGQVLLGSTWGTPTVLLVREPRETVLSLVVRHPELSLRTALQTFSRFYETCLPVASTVVVADFSSSTRDFDIVIRAVNARYGTDFSSFGHTERSVEEVFARLDRINSELGKGIDAQTARPKASKEAMKARMKSRLYSADLLAPLERAVSVYERVSKYAISG